MMMITLLMIMLIIRIRIMTLTRIITTPPKPIRKLPIRNETLK